MLCEIGGVLRLIPLKFGHSGARFKGLSLAAPLVVAVGGSGRLGVKLE
jgi:hypothetical protein